MKRRILHILGTSSVEGTSFARVVTELARGLASEYSVQAFFLGGDGTLTKMFEHAGIDCLSAARPGSVLTPIRTMMAIRGLAPSVVHQHAGGPRLTSAIRLLTGARVLRHVHGTVDEATMREPDVIHVGRPDMVVACSGYVAKKLSRSDCKVIYCGVRERATATRVQDDGTLVIGTAGRLVPAKGHRFLLRAFWLLMQEFPGARLEICGDGPERPFLEDESVRLGCAHAVDFLGWRDDFPSRCHHWDVFALPSLAEAFSIALLEAMAAGLPAVAADTGGVSELLAHERSGFLVRPADADALAGSLKALLSSATLRETMGEAGRAIAYERFSARQMVEATASVYDLLTTR